MLNINENFIIDISYLQASDHPILYDLLKELPERDLKRIIIIDAINQQNSKTTTAILKFLGY